MLRTAKSDVVSKVDFFLEKICYNFALSLGRCVAASVSTCLVSCLLRACELSAGICCETLMLKFECYRQTLACFGHSVLDGWCCSSLLAIQSLERIPGHVHRFRINLMAKIFNCFQMMHTIIQRQMAIFPMKSAYCLKLLLRHGIFILLQALILICTEKYLVLFEFSKWNRILAN